MHGLLLAHLFDLSPVTSSEKKASEQYLWARDRKEKGKAFKCCSKTFMHKKSHFKTDGRRTSVKYSSGNKQSMFPQTSSNNFYIHASQPLKFIVHIGQIDFSSSHLQVAKTFLSQKSGDGNAGPVKHSRLFECNFLLICQITSVTPDKPHRSFLNVMT